MSIHSWYIMSHFECLWPSRFVCCWRVSCWSCFWKRRCITPMLYFAGKDALLDLLELMAQSVIVDVRFCLRWRWRCVKIAVQCVDAVVSCSCVMSAVLSTIFSALIHLCLQSLLDSGLALNARYARYTCQIWFVVYTMGTHTCYYTSKLISFYLPSVVLDIPHYPWQSRTIMRSFLFVRMFVHLSVCLCTG